MTAQCPEERRVTEGILAGLRFVRNQLGHKVDLARLAGPDPESQCVRDWTWQPVPEPLLVASPRRARAWEMTRYQAYQAQLAGHAVGEIFCRAVSFLRLASADAVSATDPRLQATR
jgi:hypothetical protein